MGALEIQKNLCRVVVPHQSRVVIFGAGAAVWQLVVGLGQSRECALLAFVDDGIELRGF